MKNHFLLHAVVLFQLLLMDRVCTLRSMQTTLHRQLTPHQMLQANVGSTSARCWWGTQQLAIAVWESCLQGRVQFCLIQQQIMSVILQCTLSSMIPKRIQNTWLLSSEMVPSHSTWTVFIPPVQVAMPVCGFCPDYIFCTTHFANGSFIFQKLWAGTR